MVKEGHAMTIHIFNGFTCNAHWPRGMGTGLVCLLVESTDGLILIDTGPGLVDFANPPGILRIFKIITIVPGNEQEAAVNQVRRLGFEPEDVRHIVLTHMHFDHCGGLPDFPWAKVHVHQREYEAFTDDRIVNWSELAYVPEHISHQPEFCFYDDRGDRWFDFEAIRLPFEPEMWLIPLHGHTPGHCGVAIRTETGWHFHCGDAGVDIERNIIPDWIIKFVLGPHWPKIRDFAHLHPEIRLTASHMISGFFLE